MKFEWPDAKYKSVEEFLAVKAPALSARFVWREPEYDYERGVNKLHGNIGRVHVYINYEIEDDCRLFAWGITATTPIIGIPSIKRAKELAARWVAVCIHELINEPTVAYYSDEEEESPPPKKKPKRKKRRRKK